MIRSLIKLFGIYMGRAAYNCDMNHAFDGGEWSSGFDGDVYEHYVDQFKEDLKKVGISLNEFLERVREYDNKFTQNRKCWHTTEYQNILMSC